jgi:hypothetical protein
MGRSGALLNGLFLICVSVALGGCAARAADTTPSPACAVGDSALVRNVLYFGRNRPDGGAVTDEEWRGFMSQVLTPRFPAGLTVVSAVGQWQGKSGTVQRERSEVVTIFHPENEAARRALDEVAAEYKRRFQQEAVLRERTPTCVRFE